MGLMFKHLLYAVLCFALTHDLVHAQDKQSGFISLDCGLPSDYNYSEPTTSINYISDAPFIDTGVSRTIEAQYKAAFQQHVARVRSFPQGIRNCYRVNIRGGTKYLIRATFFYGNYDGLNKLPKFDLHLGPNFWDSVTPTFANKTTMKELIHTPSLNHVQVCLLNKGSGTPFISALEFRPLTNTIYVTNTGSLALAWRLDAASTSNSFYRYDFDVFDRLWSPFNGAAWTQITTSRTVVDNHFQVPPIVINTASTPINASSSINFFWKPPDNITQYYFYMHFAELQELKPNQYRAFNITLNGWQFGGTVVPKYLSTQTRYTTVPEPSEADYNLSIFKTEDSTLPPIINAIEAYTLKDFSQLETDEDDAVAITNIKSTYGVEKNWEGDPCAPQEYIWEGLNCSSNGLDPHRITSLNLSSSGLIGEITSYISNLVPLQSLDLSNNNLTGSIPEFLSKLPNLKVLNLEKNKLNGSVPAELVERSRSGRLTLSVGENKNLCAENSCEKKKINVLIPAIASVGGVSVLLLAAVAISMGLKRGRKPHASNNQNDSFESKGRQFTHSEILEITNNFQTILGQGGFGTVYHGYADGIQVAVKMLSPSSAQGYQEFQTEVKLLMRVHHRNLTSLVGYCNEQTTMALIYEYMVNGNLESHLLGGDSNANVLSWEGRLQIAMDASQG
ncbi:hypothetical protein ABKV19_009175 [Rosa sericea]